MRIKAFIFLQILITFLWLSCSTSKSSSSASQVTEATEKDKYQASNLFINALRERELGSLETALEMLNQADQLDPTDAAIHYEKARTLLSLGRNDEALKEARQAMNLDKSNLYYLMLFADVSKVNEKYDDYVAVYEQLLEKSPDNLDILNELAFAYYYTGDYSKAIIAYDKIEEIVGINEALSNQKVLLYDKLGETDSSLAEYENLISSDPKESRYYALMAEYCSKKKLDEKAVWAYNKIVEINPDDPYVHISLADFYKKKGETLKSFEELKLGMANPNLDLNSKINILINYFSGDLTEEQQQQALELSQILKKTHPDDIMSDTFYASMLFENKEYEKAGELFREILKQNNGNYMIWEKLLFSDLFLEQTANLALDAENAVDLFPTYPLPYYFAGIANFQLKDFVKAQAYLNSGKDFVVNNNTLLEQFFSSLGDTYHSLENFEAAYDSYDKALAINPDNALVLNNYAYFLSLQSAELEKAEKMAKKAVGLDPYSSNSLDTYAWVLYKLTKYSEALEWIKKAYANGGDQSGVVIEHYGDILFRLGNIEEAMNFWKLAKKQKEYSDLLDKKIKDQTLYE